MQADQSSVEVHIGVNSHGVSAVLRKAKVLGKRNESTRQHVVQFSMPFPKVAIVEVARVIAWVVTMNVLQDLVKNMAYHDGTSECRVRRPFYSIMDG